MQNWSKLPRMRNEIALLPSHKIDRDKWNHCIDKSGYALVYAYSWYLDHLADNWSGVILRDYEAVTPIPWRKKYGIRYSYHVPFIQQLGIYGSYNEEQLQEIVNALQSYCRYGDYPFNYRNFTGKKAENVNFIMHLDRPYETISTKFSSDVLQNIRRAETQLLNYEQGDMTEAISLYQTLYGNVGVAHEQFSRFEKLCVYLLNEGKVITRRVVEEDGSLLATALLISHQSRMYNIMNSTLPEGKKKEANYYLLSQIWKEYELSGTTFDFEGSDLPGVREFYKKFGAINQPYFKLHFNHLPWPMKLLKK